jgi:gamma-glutamyltranspeptidase/glutathione hydrolase
VSPHHLASQTAIDIMTAGGNAIDAAIAADAVLGVCLPDTCGPGGDLFALVHQPGSTRPEVLNASGRAGSGTDASALRELGLTAVPPRSPWSVTVPGCVDGWEALLDRFGRLGLDEVLIPAIALAEGGFPVSGELATSLETLLPLIGDQPSAAPFYPGGAAPSPDSPMRRPALARTLRDLQTGGRDSFFGGPVGRGITAATDGAITEADLAQRQADWVEPAGVDVFGLRAWTVPPNSQGHLTLAALWIFEQLDPPRDPADPAFQHALIEAYRAVAWERGDTTADPGSAPMRPEELLSPERLAPIAAAIDPERAGIWGRAPSLPGGTAYLATRDGDGTAVSFIQSNFSGIGSGRSAGATGVWLHNRGAGFNLVPGHPNEWMPGRRPMHTLAPTLWTRATDNAMVLGTRGGDQQPQLIMQVAADHLWSDLCPDDSQSFPRWVLDSFGPSDPPRLLVEDRFPVRTLAGLAERGHAVETTDGWQPDWGPISMISIEDRVRAAADPRISTSAALSGG